MTPLVGCSESVQVRPLASDTVNESVVVTPYWSVRSHSTLIVADFRLKPIGTVPFDAGATKSIANAPS